MKKLNGYYDVGKKIYSRIYNTTDDITNHVQEIIADLTNVLRHSAIEMAQR